MAQCADLFCKGIAEFEHVGLGNPFWGPLLGSCIISTTTTIAYVYLDLSKEMKCKLTMDIFLWKYIAKLWIKCQRNRNKPFTERHPIIWDN